MDDVTALRNALLEALPSRYFHREDMDNLDVLAALDALIAAVEARAALTPERLAKALDKMEVVGWVAMRYGKFNMAYYEKLAAAILAALATDEPVL